MTCEYPCYKCVNVKKAIVSIDKEIVGDVTIIPGITGYTTRMYYFYFYPGSNNLIEFKDGDVAFTGLMKYTLSGATVSRHKFMNLRSPIVLGSGNSFKISKDVGAVDVAGFILYTQIKD